MKKSIIVFDEAHGQRRWGQTGFPPHTVDGIYKELVAFADESLGLNVTTNLERFSCESLEQANIIVIPNPTGDLLLPYFMWQERDDAKFSTNECQSLWNFVAQGGRLLLMAHRHGDEFTKSNFNMLAQPFGIKFLPRVFMNPRIGRMGESWAPITTRIERHELTKNVHAICLDHCCPIEITNNSLSQPLVWPPKQTIEIDLLEKEYEAKNTVALAISYFGLGKVVALGSDHLFSEVLDAKPSDFHNFRLGQNILRYLDADNATETKPRFSPKVFISHQKSDKSFARKLAHDLLKRGFDVWFDEFRLMIGDSLTETIDRAVSETDFFVLVISKAALASRWVNKEYSAANALMLEGSCIKILPVVVDDCELPSFLKDLVWADFRKEYDSSLESLANSIEKHFEQHKTKQV